MNVDVAREFVGVVFHVLLMAATGSQNHRDCCCFEPPHSLYYYYYYYNRIRDKDWIETWTMNLDKGEGILCHSTISLAVSQRNQEKKKSSQNV